MSLINLIEFPILGDERGSLISLEATKNIPFEIKRVYYIWDTAHDAIRGKHAHRNLEQVIICVRGSCDFIVDDGVNRETIHLNNQAQGLYISNYVWREFTNFSEDCMVVVTNEGYVKRVSTRSYASSDDETGLKDKDFVLNIYEGGKRKPKSQWVKQ